MAESSSIVKEIFDECREKGLKLAVAESCTGGLLSALLTSVPGASVFFVESFVTYSNQSKISRLGVSADTLDEHGAVSEAVAREMVLGLLKTSGANVGVSVTGIAGPAGGTAGKPVGLVYFAVSDGFETHIRRKVFEGGREEVRSGAVVFGIEILRDFIRGRLD